MKTIVLRGIFVLLLLFIVALWLALGTAAPAVNERAAVEQGAAQKLEETVEVQRLGTTSPAVAAATAQRVEAPPQTGGNILRLPIVFYVIIVALVFALFLRFQENWDIK